MNERIYLHSYSAYKRKRPRRFLGVAVSVGYFLQFAFLVRQLRHAARHKHRLAADRILQHHTDHAQRIRRIVRQVLQTRQPAAKPRERRHIDGHRPVEQHACQSIRIELEGAGSHIRAARHQRARVSFMPQHHALHRHGSIRKWPADAHVLPRNQKRRVEEDIAPPRIYEHDCASSR